jgi:hypothetical protein
MPRSQLLGWTLALVALPFPATAHAQGKAVTVPDTEVSFPVERTEEIGGEKVALELTGVGLREKAWFNVYAIASYVAKDASAKTATQLAQADVAKQLRLVMERDVDGEDMAEAFRDALRANHPKGFDQELKAFEAYFDGKEAKEGKRIVFDHVPGKGLRFRVQGHDALEIEGVPFARAVWDIYFGKKPAVDELKKTLSARLK